MSVNVDGKVSISIRDLAAFTDLAVFQKYVKDAIEPKIISAVSDMYTTTTRAGGTFGIQPLTTRCVAPIDIGGIRGVELSVELHGKFG